MNFDKINIVSGHQPAYLPWLGLFHKLYLSDTFVFMDTLQYLDSDWNNRNLIKTSQNTLMLSIPIDKKKSLSNNLNDLIIFGHDREKSRDFWQRKHWESIKINYSKCPYFEYFKKDLEIMYLEKKWKSLIEVCWYQFNLFAKYLGLSDRRIVRMSKMKFEGKKDNLVLDHCIKLNCNAVVFGEKGKDYVDVNKFSKNKILVYFQKYISPVYKQRYNGFVPNLSALDLLLNLGPDESKKIFLKDNLTKDYLKNHSSWVNYLEVKNYEEDK